MFITCAHCPIEVIRRERICLQPRRGATLFSLESNPHRTCLLAHVGYHGSRGNGSVFVDKERKGGLGRLSRAAIDLCNSLVVLLHGLVVDFTKHELIRIFEAFCIK